MLKGYRQDVLTSSRQDRVRPQNTAGGRDLILAVGKSLKVGDEFCRW
jgi:hypothetical protein